MWQHTQWTEEHAPPLLLECFQCLLLFFLNLFAVSLLDLHPLRHRGGLAFQVALIRILAHLAHRLARWRAHAAVVLQQQQEKQPQCCVAYHVGM